jgi:hypothetical protein
MKQRNMKSKYETDYADIQSVCEIELRKDMAGQTGARSGEKEDVDELVKSCWPEAHKFPL